jgi:hypothetical protein
LQSLQVLAPLAAGARARFWCGVGDGGGVSAMIVELSPQVHLQKDVGAGGGMG